MLGTALELAGGVAIVIGVAQFSRPLGWIVSGLLGIVLAILIGDD